MSPKSSHVQVQAAPARQSPPHAPSARALSRRHRVIPPPRSWGHDHAYGLCIGVSIFVHAFVIFILGFQLPKMNVNRQQDRGLDIVLVNAKNAYAPKNPQALAQANMLGGGTVDEKVRTTSPLPQQESDQQGDALVERLRRNKQLESVQRELMTQAKSLTSIKPDQGKPTPEQTQDEPDPIKGLDLRAEARAQVKQQAIVDRHLQEYAQRPRKTFIGASTQEYRFAQYVDEWRNKVQRVGTLNYPAGSKGRLFGSLLISIEIKADGTVANAEILRSSGNKKLDDAALRIVHLAEPFGAFPPGIQKDTDILVITRTWTFDNFSVATE